MSTNSVLMSPKFNSAAKGFFSQLFSRLVAGGEKNFYHTAVVDASLTIFGAPH